VAGFGARIRQWFAEHEAQGLRRLVQSGNARPAGAGGGEHERRLRINWLV
jgi:hypothetical protein